MSGNDETIRRRQEEQTVKEATAKRAVVGTYNSSPSEGAPETYRYLTVEYEQINDNFRFLADVRFKLLALIPPLGGVAIFVLSHLGLTATDRSESSTATLLLVAIASIFGLLVTLGITIYDQRNSELYNALINRAQSLEKSFQVPSALGGLRTRESGGQFRERPKKNRRVMGVKAGHDTGLALIYGPVLGAWFFPIAYSIARLLHVASQSAAILSVFVAVVAVIVFLSNLNTV